MNANTDYYSLYLIAIKINYSIKMNWTISLSIPVSAEILRDNSFLIKSLNPMMHNFQTIANRLFKGRFLFILSNRTFA